MRIEDSGLIPRIRSRMRDWMHPDDTAAHRKNHKRADIDDETDDDEGLAWRQYIL